MATLAGSQTEKNLLKAFAGESKHETVILCLQVKLEKTGMNKLRICFLETADNERVHAKRFFSFLEGRPVEITATYPAGSVGTTLENLKAAAAGENEEHTELYPHFSEVAKEEGLMM